MSTDRREQIEHDVGSLTRGEEKTVTMHSMDVVTYRMYLAQYCGRNNTKYKTRYNREARQLHIKRVV